MNKLSDLPPGKVEAKQKPLLAGNEMVLALNQTLSILEQILMGSIDEKERTELISIVKDTVLVILKTSENPCLLLELKD